jgi:hypothetical protein
MHQNNPQTCPFRRLVNHFSKVSAEKTTLNMEYFTAKQKQALAAAVAINFRTHNLVVRSVTT